MKKAILIIIFIISVLLCSCSQPGDTQISVSAPDIPPAAPPVYDEPPAVSGITVYADGSLLSGICEKDGKLYLSAQCSSLTVQESGSSAGGHSHLSGSAVILGKAAQLDNTSTEISLGEVDITLDSFPLCDGGSWYIPMRALMQALGYTEYNDAEMNTLYYTVLPETGFIPAGYRVPIMMYHAVSDDVWGLEGLFVSPAELENQLIYLSENGYTPIFFSDLDKLSSIEKPVILSFDDGYSDNYTELFPLLKKYNCKATVFVIASAIGTGHMMSAEQIKEMADSGLVEIQSHTMTHPDLSTLDAVQLEYEYSASQLALLRITGRLPYVLCYPSGESSPAARQLCSSFYKFGILKDGGCFVTGEDDFFLVPRCRVSRGTPLASFAAMLS